MIKTLVVSNHANHDLEWLKMTYAYGFSPGFAHGFYTLTDTAEFLYKTTDYYYPEYDRTLLWNDTSLNIDWGIDAEPILSPKDKLGKTFDRCEKYV